MNLRPALTLSALGAAALVVGLVFANRTVDRPPGDGIVSLSPAISETLVAIGARDQMVGRSDYCIEPEVQELPAVGSSLTPNLEGLVRLNPGLILAESTGGTREDLLAPLAELETLPWLTLNEVTTSIRRLGELTDHVDDANAIADQLTTRLDVPVPDGPRTLLVLSAEPGGPVWYIKRNSLHGSAMHAAGLQNAINEDVSGPPNVSLERLITLDPHWILFMLPDGSTAGEVEAATHQLDALEPLTAVREGRVRALAGDLQSTGPRILDLVQALEPYATP